MEEDGMKVNDKPSLSNFAIGHVLVLLVIFFPPFAYCLFLGIRIDAAYFLGHGTLVAALALVPLTLLFPAIYVCGIKKINSRMVLCSIWAPVLIFAIAGSRARMHGIVAMNALESRDCYAFPDKRKLHRAYLVASELRQSCTTRPGLLAATIEECPGYEEAAASWPRQFRYLKSLESRFPCSGVCSYGERLWFEPGTMAPSCGPFAAQWLWSAHTQATIVLTYSVIVGLASIPTKLLLIDPLMAHFKD